MIARSERLGKCLSRGDGGNFLSEGLSRLLRLTRADRVDLFCRDGGRAYSIRYNSKSGRIRKAILRRLRAKMMRARVDGQKIGRDKQIHVKQLVAN